MTVLEMFEKVNLAIPIEQRRFFNYLNDSIEELIGLFGSVPKLVYTSEHKPINSLDSEITILPLYHGALINNILFLLTGNEINKSEFLRKVREVNLKYWNDNAKGRRIKKGEW